MAERPRIAFWFRYGYREQAVLFPAIPAILEQLTQSAEVHYFGPRDRIADHPPVPGVTYHHLPWTVDRRSDRDKLIKTLRWLLALPGLGRRCRKLGIDLVYIDETVPLSAGLARRFFGPNVILTVADLFVSNYGQRHAWLRAPARWIEHCDRAAWRRLPALFTRSGSGRDMLIREGFDAARIHPVYDPCDVELYHPRDRAEARRASPWQPDDYVLTFHGILHPNKGLAPLVEALAGLMQRHGNLRFWIIGEGPERAALEALAMRLGIGKLVRFEGYTEAAAVAPMLAAGDAGLVSRTGRRGDDLVITSVLVHYMAMRIPVLAAATGGIREIVDEHTGTLYPPGDAKAFAAGLEWMIGHPEESAARAGHAYAKAMQLFPIPTIADQTCRVLLETASALRS